MSDDAVPTAIPAPLDALVSILRTQFTLSAHALHKNLAGLTGREVTTRPDPAGNSIHWILGHIVASRGQILRQVGEEPVLAADLAAGFGRGDSADPSPTGAIDLETLRKAFDESQERLLSRLEHPSEAMLADPAWGDRLGGLAFHESYHVGQIGLLRRLLGHEGAIR